MFKHERYVSNILVPKIQGVLMTFMEQCAQLLGYFGIEVKHINNTDKEDRVRIAYRISDVHDNLIKYVKLIGYRYDKYKIVESSKVVEIPKIQRQNCKKKY